MPNAFTTAGLRAWRYFSPRLLEIRDFSGGLNLRDAQSELANNESPDLWNVTLDERGGIMKRLGYGKWNLSTYGSTALVQALFYWAGGTTLMVQAGASIYADPSTTPLKTFSTSARVGFADFMGKLWVIHPVDGLFNWDGVAGAMTAVGGGPKGNVLTPWQNRLIATGDPAQPPRVYGSAIGDGTDWTTAAGHGWTNDLREKDSEPIIALAGASGIDIIGRPGLIAFKRRSCYRIYDQATGFAQMLDPSVGCASALAHTTLFGETIFIGERGIYKTNGVATPVPASVKLEPLWNPTMVAFDKLDLWCAGTVGDRVYFSLPRAGSTVPDLALEYHPLQGWITTGSNAMSCYATYGKLTGKLIGGSTTVNGQAYELLKSGSDNGAAIHSWFQTRWFEPNAGIKSRLREVDVIGRGAFSLYRRRDFESGQGVVRQVVIPTGGFTWNGGSAVWNDPLNATQWGPAKVQNYQPLHSLGVGRAIAFRVDETSTTSYTGQPLLGSGTAPEVGAWALYGFNVLHVPLGLA